MKRSTGQITGLLLAVVLVAFPLCMPAGAQSLAANAHLPVGPRPVPLAQASPPTTKDVLPTDLTPVRLPERGDPFQAFKTEALYLLPARFFFNANVENTARLETNVFQTLNNNRSDLIYRVLPNVTAGYALTRRTRVSANYFFLRDTYAVNHQLNRNIHNVGFRVDQDFPLNAKTNLSVGFFGRELFLTNQPSLNDLIPSAVVVRQVGRKGLVYASVLGQVRFRKVLGRYQEFDQFYSIGGVYRARPWIFSFDTTLISNFRKRALAFGPDSQVIIITAEAGRQIPSRIPVPLTAFVRLEPIFNIGASQAQGFAGVNVRVFGGIRAEVSKPAIFPVRFRQ